jgi:hypothetical protein
MQIVLTLPKPVDYSVLNAAVEKAAASTTGKFPNYGAGFAGEEGVLCRLPPEDKCDEKNHGVFRMRLPQEGRHNKLEVEYEPGKNGKNKEYSDVFYHFMGEFYRLLNVDAAAFLSLSLEKSV